MFVMLTTYLARHACCLKYVSTYILSLISTLIWSRICRSKEHFCPLHVQLVVTQKESLSLCSMLLVPTEYQNGSSSNDRVVFNHLTSQTHVTDRQTNARLV